MSGRIRFTSARQVFDTFATAREDITATPAEETPIDYARSLARSTRPEEAVAFCAYLLPRREAVWWACQALRGLDPRLAQSPALAVAEDWVREPEEERRREALRIGLAASPAVPDTWLALAAGWSGGSMSEPERPLVPPPAYLTAKAVRAAILLSAARQPAERRARAVQACVEAGLRFAEGGDARLRLGAGE